MLLEEAWGRAGKPVRRKRQAPAIARYILITKDMVRDPDAFAMKLVGDSMASEFTEGDFLVFSPKARVVDGDACLVQLSDVAQ